MSAAPPIATDVVGVRRAVLSAAGSIDPVTWMLTAAVTIGTNLSDFVTMPPPGESPGAIFFAAVAARVLLVFWIGYVLPRRIAGVTRPYAVTSGFAPFAALLVAMLFGYGLVQKLIIGPMTATAPLEQQWLLMLCGTALWTAVTIRLIAWQAHLAIGGTVRQLGAVFAGQRGVTLPILLAFIALILPVAAIHLALILVGIKLSFPPMTVAALAFVDGVVQMVQLGLTAALSVVALRLALQKTAAPR